MSTEDFEPDLSKPKRFISVDALRGFDMFWILGADGLAYEMPLSDGRMAGKLDHEAVQETYGALTSGSISSNNNSNTSRGRVFAFMI